MWLLIFVIGSLIVSFLISPNTFHSFKQNVKEITSSKSNLQGKAIQNIEIKEQTIPEEPLITKCKTSYNFCENVFEEKFGLSASLIKYQKFDNSQEANKFYSIWKGPMQFGIEYEIGFPYLGTLIEDSLPLTLFAIKTTDGQTTAPAVLICDKNGDLIQFSKNIMVCG